MLTKLLKLCISHSDSKIVCCPWDRNFWLTQNQNPEYQMESNCRIQVSFFVDCPLTNVTFLSWNFSGIKIELFCFGFPNQLRWRSFCFPWVFYTEEGRGEKGILVDHFVRGPTPQLNRHTRQHNQQCCNWGTTPFMAFRRRLWISALQKCSLLP